MDGALPEPTLDGDKATYENVEPNLNIVITAETEGFEQNFVLTGPPTASELALVLPLAAPGLSTHATSDGGINFTNSDSDQAGTILPAYMWDARTDPASGLPTDEVQLSLAATSHALDVTSPASFFSDPSLQYPVTIDPTFTDPSDSRNPSGDTYVRSDYPTTTYGSDTELQVGTYNGGASVARSFINFDDTKWENATITGATLALYEFHSYSCTASKMWVYSSDLASSSDDWNNQPSLNKDYEGNDTFAYGYNSSCAANTDNISVRTLTQHLASKGIDTVTYGLEAASETSDDSWKRFNSNNASSNRPLLTVTYFYTPSVPSAPTLLTGARGCGSSTAPVYVNNLSQDLTLSSNVTDHPAGTPMVDIAKVYSTTLSGSTYTANTSSLEYTTDVSAEAVSGNVTMTIYAAAHNGQTPLATGFTYAVEARTQIADSTLDGYASGWSTWCYFTVKNTAPAIPTITPATLSGTTVGSPISVQFTAPVTDAPAVFAYWWVSGTATGEPDVPVTGTSADISIAAPLPANGTGDGQVRYATGSNVGGTFTSNAVTVAPISKTATLWVAVYDAAGNESAGPSSAHAKSAGVTVTADPAVDDVHGHSWIIDGNTTVSSPVADTNTTSGSAPTAATNLLFGTTSSTAAVNGLINYGSPSTGFVFSGASTDTLTSTAQAVDTKGAFTVSAFVDPVSASPSSAETAVSEEVSSTGSGGTAFNLGMSSAGKYEFCVNSVATPGTTTCAVAAAVAEASSGEFITGMWDPQNQAIRLLVGGTQSAVAWYPLPTGEVSATGPLLVGASETTGSLSNEWKGDITDPSIFPGIADADQLASLQFPRDVNAN